MLDNNPHYYSIPTIARITDIQTRNSTEIDKLNAIEITGQQVQQEPFFTDEYGHTFCGLCMVVIEEGETTVQVTCDSRAELLMSESNISADKAKIAIIEKYSMECVYA